MSKHLFGLVATPYGTAANNRGETEGNITTLQKILWKGEVHSTVSAEAIRWAIRYAWQRMGIEVNRKWIEDKADHEWLDETASRWRDGFDGWIDDDVMGFMTTEAARVEGDEEEIKAGKGKKVKGHADKRRGVLEVTRAISLTPFGGDITFNAKSGEKGTTSLYGTEVHATRYQYGFALTPEWLRVKDRAPLTIEALVALAEVAGNQSRFLFDFSPDAIVFRWTDDFAPRILYGFEGGEQLAAPALLPLLESGDIDPNELILGQGAIAVTEFEALKNKGAFLGGVKAAAEEVKKRMRADLGIG